VSTLAIRIAEGGIADLPAVMAVMDDSFEAEFGEAWTASQCAGLLPLPGVWLTLAHERGEPVGFALSRLVADEAELLLLAVRRPSQGQGTGRALLADFVARAARRGAVLLHLEVRDGNPAMMLYERSGFAAVGRRRDYYRGLGGGRYDAITLAKNVEAGQ